MTISTKIEKLRKRKGISQEEFANEIGVSRQAVFKWESGENTPDIEKIKKIVLFFNISFDALLNDEIDIDDNCNIIQPQSSEKPHRHINKKALIISLICLAATAVMVPSTIFAVKGIQYSINETNSKKQINHVIALIDDIGEITLESESAIIEAEDAYNALNDKQKSKVTNYDTLVMARNEYEGLAYNYREEQTKNDPTRCIVLSDINGHWQSSYDEWKIQDLGNFSSVLYWTSLTANGSVISTNLKDSYLVGYNNVTMRMEIELYHYYAHGEEFLDVSMTKDSSDTLTLYYLDRIYTKIE